MSWWHLGEGSPRLKCANVQLHLGSSLLMLPPAWGACFLAGGNWFFPGAGYVGGCARAYVGRRAGKYGETHFIYT